MSQTAPEGIYVYQPFGTVTHPEREKTGRLFGLGGLPIDARVDGLTRAEAEAIAAALNARASQPGSIEAAARDLVAVVEQLHEDLLRMWSNDEDCEDCGDKVAAGNDEPCAMHACAPLALFLMGEPCGPHNDEQPFPRTSKVTAALRAALDGTPARCAWTPDDDGIYHTDCGHTFYFDGSGGPIENKQKFCGYCGRPIEEKAR